MSIKQSGFTLIELVMVIIIIGILAAVALPKFADLSQDARIAALTAGRGAAVSAINIVHSQAVIEGKEAAAISTTTLEGTTINLVYGYPKTGGDLGAAAGLIAPDFSTGSQQNSVYVIMLNLGGSYTSDCSFRYTPATSATSPAIVSTARTHSPNPNSSSGC